MGGRGGLPLQDRVSARGEAVPGVAAAGTRPPGRRHCWVRLPDIDVEVEGIVCHWRRDGGAWLTLVVYVVEWPTGIATVQQWLSASRLRPVRDDR
jgi:hypothetical protein